MSVALTDVIDPYVTSLQSVQIAVYWGLEYKKSLYLIMSLMDDAQTFSIYRNGELIDTYKDYVGAVQHYNRVTATSRELSLRK